jgi:hypothetical protein
MKLRKYISKFLHDQSGNAAVIVALSMTVMMGFSAFVLDLGVSYNEAAKLQNALDSAVLAAAQELPADNTLSAEWTQTRSEALAYAAANGFPIDAADIEPIYKDDISSNKIIGIRATKSIEVEYNFAKVLGMDSGTVTRSASAGIVPAGGITNAVPLSITTTSLSTAIAAGAINNLTIKCSSNANEVGIDCTGVSGWFAPLRFDGSGASTYADLITYGFSGAIRVGQVLDIENGNMSGTTLDGFMARYGECMDGCTPDSYDPDCPRLIFIPVITILTNGQVRIDAFASFFITECGGTGNDSFIKATYIPYAVVPNAAAGADGQDFGLYVVKLFS